MMETKRCARSAFLFPPIVWSTHTYLLLEDYVELLPPTTAKGIAIQWASKECYPMYFMRKGTNLGKPNVRQERQELNQLA